MLVDYHVHTEYSDDSFYPMEKVVKDAITLGIKELCFTDHVDYGILSDNKEGVKYELTPLGKPKLNVNYPKYFEEITLLQERYEGKIVIKKGLEFGVQTHTIKQYQELFKKYSLDFVILSIHQIGNKEFWNQIYQEGKSQKEYNDAYYQELYDVITLFSDYSVLGHLDLIKRYDKFGEYPFENNKEIITKILQHVIKEGKGIEINTSSHRYGVSDLTPSKDILKLYHELGGTVITLGSDSHSEEHLGAYIKETMAILREIGFKHHCTFENMRPSFHPL